MNKSSKKSKGNVKIPKKQNQNVQNRNRQIRNGKGKSHKRRNSYHGQKLFGFVMFCCLVLFLYAFLVVRGYWPQQGGLQEFGNEGLQENSPGNGLSASQNNGTDSEEAFLEIHFIDVGQGDATLIKCEGETLLIDAAGEDKGTSLHYYLMKQGVKKLDYLVLTHPDADHIGSADVILTKFPVENVIMSYYEKESTSYRNLKDTLEYQRIEPQIAEVGQSFDVGSAHCTVIGPVQEYEDANNASVILLVEHGENRFLFTGDAEVEAEEALIKYTESLQDVEALQAVALLQADVYKAGHHGSSTSSTEKLLDAVKPAYTVISCAKGNDYGHPHAETMERFLERNILVFRTDEQGTIVAISDGENITWDM